MYWIRPIAESNRFTNGQHQHPRKERGGALFKFNLHPNSCPNALLYIYLPVTLGLSCNEKKSTHREISQVEAQLVDSKSHEDAANAAQEAHRAAQETEDRRAWTRTDGSTGEWEGVRLEGLEDHPS